jgi:hypothetical protein
LALKKGPYTDMFTTMLRNSLLVLGIFLLSGRVLSEASLPPEILQPLQEKFPGQFNPLSVAVGDLNNDGLDDFATVIFPGPDPELTAPAKIVVFLQKSKGAYQLFSASDDIFGNPLGAIDIQIRKSSLFLDRSGSAGCCFGFRESFQFQFRGNDFLLIGLEGSTFDKLNVSEGFGESINFLTNRAIHWRMIGKKRKEIEKILSSVDLISLHQFTAGTGVRYVPKEVAGHLDENFEFKPRRLPSQ